MSINEDVKEEFETLARRWRKETALISSVDDLCTHDAYQAIIGIGPPAVPLILRELELEPGHWFVALRAITGLMVDGEAPPGNVGAMARAWTDWGRRNGLLQP